MKAEDKIYVREYPDGSFNSAWETKRKDDPTIILHEYIRKETLLEWVNVYKTVIETNGEEDDAYTRGQYSAILTLIDKLNEM